MDRAAIVVPFLAFLSNQEVNAFVRSAHSELNDITSAL
jgi:hypothetical protein